MIISSIMLLLMTFKVSANETSGVAVKIIPETLVSNLSYKDLLQRMYFIVFV